MVDGDHLAPQRNVGAVHDHSGASPPCCSYHESWNRCSTLGIRPVTYDGPRSDSIFWPSWESRPISGDFLRTATHSHSSRRANVQDKGGLLSMKRWPWEFLLSAGLFGAAWIWARVTNFAPFSNDPISIPTAFVLSVLLLFASYCLLPVGVRLVNGYAKWRDKSKPPKRVSTTRNRGCKHSSCSRSWLLPFSSLQCYGAKRWIPKIILVS